MWVKMSMSLVDEVLDFANENFELDSDQSYAGCGYIAASEIERRLIIATLAQPDSAPLDSAAAFFYRCGGKPDLKLFCEMVDLHSPHRGYLLDMLYRIEAEGRAEEDLQTAFDTVKSLLSSKADLEKACNQHWWSEEIYELIIRIWPREAAPLIWNYFLKRSSEPKLAEEFLEERASGQNPRSELNDSCPDLLRALLRRGFFGWHLFDLNSKWFTQLLELGSAASIELVLEVLGGQDPFDSIAIGLWLDDLTCQESLRASPQVIEILRRFMNSRRRRIIIPQLELRRDEDVLDLLHNWICDLKKSQPSSNYSYNEALTQLYRRVAGCDILLADGDGSLGSWGVFVQKSPGSATQYWFSSPAALVSYLCLEAERYIPSRWSEGSGSVEYEQDLLRRGQIADEVSSTFVLAMMAFRSQKQAKINRVMNMIEKAWVGEQSLLWCGEFRDLLYGEDSFAVGLRKQYFEESSLKKQYWKMTPQHEDWFAEWLQDYDGDVGLPGSRCTYQSTDRDSSHFNIGGVWLRNG
jgi:hypothetical protein